MKDTAVLSEKICFEPVGIIRSCFREKFGIPRQAGLAPDARAELKILPAYRRPEAFRGLEAFSHLWIIFVFHASVQETWRPTVRPPRLGGNRRIGVFATRSNFRPNPIGMSAVRLEKIICGKGQIVLRLAGADLLDGTPVLDIKPYLPYADAVPGAFGGFAAEAPENRTPVRFSDQALEVCREKAGELPHLQRLIIQMLQHDPRPAYYGENTDRRRFGMKLYDMDIQWEWRENGIWVSEIVCGQ